MSAAEPIIIETPTVALKLIDAQIDPLVARAAAIEIHSQELYESAAAFLVACKSMQKEIGDTMDPVCQKAHEAHKSATATRAKFLDPVVKAEKLVKGKMGAYLQEQERKANEKRRAEEAIARKAEEDRRLAEASELEARGQTRAAERVIEAPIVLPSVPQAAAPTAAGVSSRKKYSAKVVDLMALVREVYAAKVSAFYLLPNQSAIDALAAASKEGFALPGCELVVETVISGRAR